MTANDSDAPNPLSDSDGLVDIPTAIGLYLDKVGQEEDSNIDLAKTALMIGVIESPSLHLGRYEHHIQKLIDEVAARYKELQGAGADDTSETQLAALKFVMIDTHNYSGDIERYDDLQNMNLIRVIERRKGIPAALSLIYMHVAQAQGWGVTALNFPAHVICRIEKEGKRLIFDPFNGCAVLNAPELRVLLKGLIGDQVELSADYYEASTKRELLIRLQNNKKLRQIEGEDYEGALQCVQIMQKIAPDEYRLLLDAGVLYARTHHLNDAVGALEKYIELVPDEVDAHDAVLLLRQIRESLN
jgi:regulator of sirC expression with transglutaminase-like and TPR domain